jgi:hypothetical protein
MYYNDHAPPHFHATYAGNEATFAIDTLAIMYGDIPRRARSLVLEWAQAHREELIENWNLARAGAPLVEVEPLE